MASWTAHSLFTFGGVLNTGAPDPEIWQCGVRIGNTGAGGQLGDPDAFLTYAVTPMSAWWASVDGFAPTTATLKWLKVGQIGTNGHYSDTTPHIHDYAGGGVAGTSGTPKIPDILGLAVSWQTTQAVRRGSYASHGRIYLPTYGLNPAIAGSMRIQSAQLPFVRDWGKALLTLINTAPQPAVPIIASGHGGEVHTIVGVRVGDVLDVQRRRKDALRETYVSATFP